MTPKMLKQMVILAVVAAVLVFVVTLVKQLGPSSRGGSSVGEGVKPKDSPLCFPLVEAHWGREGPGRTAEVEWAKPGHYDFWFENLRSEPVQLGLRSKNCKCSGVDACVVTKEWQARTGLFEPFGALPSLLYRQAVAATDPSLEWHTLSPPPDNRKGIIVPPGAGGWVRLDWNKARDPSGPSASTVLDIEVWMDTPDGIGQKLLVPLFFVEPLRIELPVVSAGDLSYPARVRGEVEFLAWSSTRPTFALRVEAPADPFVSCAEPQPLSAEECGRLTGEKLGLVLSGYRVRITVLERLSDGRQLDLGPFERRLVLKADADVPPLTVVVSGVVRGDITVGVGSQRDRLDLGTFNAAHDFDKKTGLLTGGPDTVLQVDQVPDFLRVVHLKQDENNKRSWELRVMVPANRLDGPVPEDAAVYLKTAGDNPRRIRIPVIGSAFRR